MYQGYKVIDADAHITEPNDLWSEFMEAEFYDRRPIVGDPEDDRPGARRTFGPCELFPEGNKPKGTLMGGGHQRRAQRSLNDFMPQKYGEAWDVSFTPESRVKDMERLGWDKMVCIDNFPGPIRAIQEGADQALLWACARAYNNYSRAFCDTDASKLKMVAVVPDQHDAEGLIVETRRAVAELGRRHRDRPPPRPRARAGTTRSTTPSGPWLRSWTSPCPSTAFSPALPGSAHATSLDTSSPARRSPWSTP